MFPRIFQSKILTGGIALFSLWLVVSLARVDKPIKGLESELNNVNQKIEEAKQKNQRLSQEQEYLSSQAYLERQSRLRLNYKKPDEEAVLIYKTQPTEIDNKSNKSANLWDNIKKFIDKIF